MNTLQPGCMAMITNHKYLSNIGHTVTLIRFVEQKETIDLPSVGEMSNMTGYSGWLVAGDVYTRNYDPDDKKMSVQDGFCICEPQDLIEI